MDLRRVRAVRFCFSVAAILALSVAVAFTGGCGSLSLSGLGPSDGGASARSADAGMRTATGPDAGSSPDASPDAGASMDGSPTPDGSLGSMGTEDGGG